jgi:hypothetical protein
MSQLSPKWAIFPEGDQTKTLEIMGAAHDFFWVLKTFAALFVACGVRRMAYDLRPSTHQGEQ